MALKNLNDKIKESIKVTDYKSYITCKCAFFQASFFIFCIIFNTLMFSITESDIKNVSNLGMENSSILLNSTLLGSINMIDKTNSEITEDLENIYIYTQKIYTNSFSNYETYCTYSNRKSCQIYGYEEQDFKNYTKHMSFSSNTYQYKYLSVSSITTGEIYSTLDTIQKTNAQKFWNNIFLAQPIFINLVKSYNNDYTGFIKQTTILKRDSMSATKSFYEWNYPSKSASATINAKKYWDIKDKNYKDMSLNEPVTHFTEVDKDNKDKNCFILFLLSSDTLAVISIDWYQLFVGYTILKSNFFIKWFIIDANNKKVLSYPVNTELPKEELYVSKSKTKETSFVDNYIDKCDDYSSSCQMFYTKKLGLSNGNKSKYNIMALVGLENQLQLDSEKKSSWRLLRIFDFLLYFIIIQGLHYYILQMFDLVYKILFTPINQFSYLLEKFNSKTLKDNKNEKFDDFNINLIIFNENNEYQKFFETFFRFFKNHQDYGNLDIEKKYPQNNRDVINEKFFCRKFNENILEPIKDNYKLLRIKLSISRQFKSNKEKKKII